MNMNLHEFSGICPLYVLRNQKADHVTKFQLQSSVAQRVGTCIVHFCLNSKPRAVHTIEACINQYGSFLKWVYPKSSWVSMRKWFNDWMFWGHPYFRKPPYWVKLLGLVLFQPWPYSDPDFASEMTNHCGYYWVVRLSMLTQTIPIPDTGIQCQVTFSNLVSNMSKCCILYCRTTTTVVWDV